jgi:hypothetical protein
MPHDLCIVVAGKAHGWGHYQNKVPLRTALNSGDTPLQGPYHRNDHVSSYSSHKEMSVGTYKNVKALP